MALNAIAKENETNKEDPFNYDNFLLSLSHKTKVQQNHLLQIISLAEKSRKKLVKEIYVDGEQYILLKRGIGPLVTKYGKFYLMVFNNDNEKESEIAKALFSYQFYEKLFHVMTKNSVFST